MTAQSHGFLRNTIIFIALPLTHPTRAASVQHHDHISPSSIQLFPLEAASK